MADPLVELDDRTIHPLMHRAEESRLSLNDVMLEILVAAAAEEPDLTDGGDDEASPG
jgi:hypothetical protein